LRVDGYKLHFDRMGYLDEAKKQEAIRLEVQAMDPDGTPGLVARGALDSARSEFFSPPKSSPR